MMRKILCSTMLVVSLALAGCASGQKFNEMSSSIPALRKNEGRIYFMRDTEFGFAVQPDIRLNGQVVGTAKPRGFFYVDRAKGDYTVSISTEVEKTITFHLNAGETKYINTDVSMGLLVAHVTPVLTYPEQARSKLNSLSYIGQ